MLVENDVIDWQKPLPEYKYLPRDGSTIDPLKNLDQLVTELLVNTHQQVVAPINFRNILLSRRVESIEKHVLRKRGYLDLTNANRNFQIIVSSAQSVWQQRLTIAHEIGHTFFFTLESEDGFLCQILRRSDYTKEDEEKFCETFAHQLLKSEKEYRLWQRQQARKRRQTGYQQLSLPLCHT